MNGLLHSLSPGERFAASSALRRCPRVRIDARGTLEASELRRSKLLFVEHGIVLLVAERPRSRRPAVLTVAGPGSLIVPPASEERIVGATNAAVALVPEAVLEELLALPAFSQLLFEALLAAVRERQQSLANATGGTHMDRLREKLFQLARDYGTVGPDGVQIELPLTHELLAQMVGSARETVTCSLARLRSEGLLERTERGYRLKIEPDALETLVV
jgi:CRP/FNR family cyclic AMP-dependent transcriptional regulator